MEPHDENQIRLLTEVLPQVATQLRGALGNIYGAMHGISRVELQESDPKFQQNTAILNQSYHRLLRLVNNLSAAPMLAEDAPFLLENTELVAWLDALCRQAEPLAELSGISLRFETDLRHHVVAIHSEHLERLVWNFLSNALKFTPRGGTVTVSLRRSGGQMLLSVKDTGCGIPPERLEGIFDRYLHSDYMDPLPHGLGLGLPLCRRIAQGHGGRLLLQSQEGEGTTVTMSWPDRRTSTDKERDVPFQYAGGFQVGMMELSDALPYQAFFKEYMD